MANCQSVCPEVFFRLGSAPQGALPLANRVSSSSSSLFRLSGYHLISVLLSGYWDERNILLGSFDKFDPDDQSSRPKIRCPPRFSVFSALRLSGKPHTARLTLLRFLAPLYPTQLGASACPYYLSWMRFLTPVVLCRNSLLAGQASSGILVTAGTGQLGCSDTSERQQGCCG